MQEPWIYIVVLGTVAIVYSLLLPKRRTSRSPELVNEMERAMERYAGEMLADNKQLFELLLDMKARHSREISLLNERITELEQRYSGMISAVPEREPEPEPERTVGPGGFRQRFPDLFRMHDQGMAEDDIAKVAGMNKGEVQLILRLGRREAAADVP